jgi:hypothetical protein
MTHDHPAAKEQAKLPTPARPVRHNEWTRARMVAFLKELAACQSVSDAALSVGMSRHSAYKLRNRLAFTPFALAWEVALEAGLQQLAHAVMDRAINGEEVPRFYHGELVAVQRRYDNRLATSLLDNPWKVGRQQVAREFVAEGWDRLLERIEFEPLDWQAGEGLPGRNPPPTGEADVFGEDLECSEEEREMRRVRALTDEQDAFMRDRSWYIALAREDGERGKRGRRG